MIKQKIFKDPLYNYIYVDEDICTNIIDNKYFQRLRRIEQTSMRCLYPSARHDRFIHSLGTYNLAKIAIEAIYENDIIIVGNDNANEEIKSQNTPSDTDKNFFKFTFEMAALLHDIGHSPFSHTLEDYFKNYYYKDLEGVKSKDIINILFENMEKIQIELCEEDFTTFKSDCNCAKSAPHEIASCIIILRCFKDILDKLAQSRCTKINYCLLTRCILGAQYSSPNIINNYKNCIIKLLNSSIDVDKLDYISRDSQVSGYDNTMVYTNRLLKALNLALYKDTDTTYKMCIAFKKTALGVIQNVVLSRNSLYTWIYSHHKVKYESYLINEAINAISKLNESPKIFGF